jgi:hypothetical protein
VRVPVLVVAEAEAVWMNFLTHFISPVFDLRFLIFDWIRRGFKSAANRKSQIKNLFILQL